MSETDKLSGTTTGTRASSNALRWEQNWHVRGITRKSVWLEWRKGEQWMTRTEREHVGSCI